MLYGQATSYSLKIPFTLGLQTWDRLDTDPMLFTPGVLLEIESLNENETASVYASLGYVARGSRTRIRSFINSENERIVTSGSFTFRNASLQLGARAIKPWTESKTLFYGLAGRLEYNVSNNLDQYQDISGNIFTTLPVPGFVNDFTYGLTLSGGIFWYLNDRFDGVFEIQINADVNNQYTQPTLNNVRDPRTGNPTTLPSRTVRNNSVEFIVGVRLFK